MNNQWLLHAGASLLLAMSLRAADPAATNAAASSAWGDPDLTGYRTVVTALKAKNVRPPIPPAARTGYLGLEVEPNSEGELVVAEVEQDSPAMVAGAEPGDVLLGLADKPVKSATELRALLQAHAPGETLPLTLERLKKPLALKATLNAVSRPMGSSLQRTSLGARLVKPENGSAVIIDRITAGSPAADAGLQEGDVVMAIDAENIASAEFARGRLEDKQPGDTINFSLLRAGAPLVIEASLPPAQDPRDNRARALWKKPVYRLAVILVEYPDVKHEPTVASRDWSELFFSTNRYVNKRNATGQTVYGSVNDFYQEASAGGLRIEGRVFDWVQVSRKRADYALDAGPSYNRSFPLLIEAIDKLRDRDGNAALRDYDGLFFVHAGDRVPNTIRGGLYWPHMSGMSYRGQRWNYVLCPAGQAQMADISVYSHEFGHLLGLPDLYARPESPNSDGIGEWCLMSEQSGRGRPQHPSAWCKIQLGWLKPVTIDPTVKQKLILGPVEGSTNECYKVLLRPDGSEYFLLENRRKTGFDRSLPGEGLLIWRVVGNRPTLEESHGVEGARGLTVFPSSVPYPSRANKSFTPYTSPASRSLLGEGLPVYLTNIRQLHDGRVTFEIGHQFE